MSLFTYPLIQLLCSTLGAQLVVLFWEMFEMLNGTYLQELGPWGGSLGVGRYPPAGPLSLLTVCHEVSATYFSHHDAPPHAPRRPAK